MRRNALDEAEAFVAWCQDEDLRLRREAESDPKLAALLAEADRAFEAKYGHSWVNPKAS